MFRDKVTRRGFLSSSALAGLGAILAACSPKSTPTTAPKEEEPVEQPLAQEPAEKEPVTIRFNGRTGNEEDIYKERLEPFEEAYPDIKVLIECFPSAEYHQKMEVMYAGGTAADTIYDIAVGAYYHRHAHRGEFMALEDLISATEFEMGQFFPSVVEGITFDGKIYGLPRNCHPSRNGLYYNKNLLAEAGIDEPEAFDPSSDSYGDWELTDFLTMAQTLTKDNDGDGKTDQFGILFGTDINSVGIWVRGFGGWNFSEDGREWLMDSDEALAAFQYLYDLVHVHQVSPTPAQTVDNMFDTGMLGMWLTGVWGKRARGRVGDRFEIGGVPMAKGPAGFIGLGSEAEFDPLCLYSGSEHPQEAFEWLKWLTNQETGIRLGEHGMAPGARPDVWNSPRLLGDPLFEMFNVIMPNSKPLRIPWNFRGAEVTTAFKNTADLMWLGKATAEETVSTLSTEIQGIMDLPREDE